MWWVKTKAILLDYYIGCMAPLIDTYGVWWEKYQENRKENENETNEKLKMKKDRKEKEKE